MTRKVDSCRCALGSLGRCHNNNNSNALLASTKIFAFRNYDCRISGSGGISRRELVSQRERITNTPPTTTKNTIHRDGTAQEEQHHKTRRANKRGGETTREKREATGKMNDLEFMVLLSLVVLTLVGCSFLNCWIEERRDTARQPKVH